MTNGLLSDIIVLLESNPGAGGLTLGTMFILYPSIARNVRADNREDNAEADRRVV